MPLPNFLASERIPYASIEIIRVPAPKEPTVLANDLINSQRDLAVAHMRIAELEATVCLRDQEIHALSQALDRALSTKRCASVAIQELQRTLHEVGASR